MFTYFQPTRLHFGPSVLNRLPAVAKNYGSRCCLVTTEDQPPLKALYDRIKRLLAEAGIECLHFAEVRPNPSTEMIEKGVALLKTQPIDFLLAVGGGSSIDSAKALALTYGMREADWGALLEQYSSPFENYPLPETTVLPLLSVPTTSGTGSQVTQAAVVTYGGEKLTFYHPCLFSKETFIDPELLLALPKRLTAATGFDAFTHAFESFISRKASFLSRQDSLTALRLIVRYLPEAYADGSNLSARSHMCLADYCAGKALANGGAQAPHPLSELIGSSLPVPHGEALALVYPAFIRASYAAHSEDYQEILELFRHHCALTPDARTLDEAVSELLNGLGLTRRMADYGMDDSLYQKMLKNPLLDHLPFGDRRFLTSILDEAR